jgi:beta-lactam-binding protein with PASTA domain
VVTRDASGRPGCVVPKLRGHTNRYAVRMLHKNHCRVGKRTKRFNGKIKRGRVVGSRARAGRRYVGNARVNYTISRGRRLASRS